MAEPLLQDEQSVIDVGSGVGIPGLPLALLSPDRSMYLLEPRQACIGLIHWLINQLPDINTRVIEDKIQDVNFTNYPSLNVLTRAALDWDTLSTALPENNGPIIRWSGPDVDSPPKKSGWIHKRLSVHYDRFSQEFIWWGPESIYERKIKEWDTAKSYSVITE